MNDNVKKFDNFIKKDGDGERGEYDRLSISLPQTVFECISRISDHYKSSINSVVQFVQIENDFDVDVDEVNKHKEIWKGKEIKNLTISLLKEDKKIIKQLCKSNKITMTSLYLCWLSNYINIWILENEE